MRRKTLTNVHVAEFCAETAILLAAGYTPLDAVLALKEDDADSFAAADALTASLSVGYPLSAALRDAGIFPAYVISMTEAGEKTGRLTEALRMLSEYYERRERLTQAVRDAVAYPLVLFVMLAATVGVLAVKVLPVFTDAYARLGAMPPPAAGAPMRAGGWMEQAAQAAVVIAGGCLVLALAARLSKTVRGALLRFLHRAAGDRGVFRRMAAARYTSVMSLALSSGLVYDEAVVIAENALGFLHTKRYPDCAAYIRSGMAPADALYKAGILSAGDKRRLAVGSRSGTADTAMADIAARCDHEARDVLERAVGMIEPALVIGASVMVGIIILSVMLPLMSIMTAI